jgi:hypothetical protein
MNLRNKCKDFRNLGVVLTIASTLGLTAFPLIAKAETRLNEHQISQIKPIASVNNQPESQYNLEYFGIAPNGQPIAIDYSNYAGYAVQPKNSQVQETATWRRVADRVGKSDCLQNIYTGKVLCQEIDAIGDRLVVDRR